MSKSRQWFLRSMMVVVGVATVALVVRLASCGLDWETASRCEASALGAGALVAASLIGSQAARRGGWGWVALIGCGMSLVVACGVGAFIWMGEDILERIGGYPLESSVADALGTGGVVASVMCLGPVIMKPKMKLAGRLVQWGTVASLVGAAGLMLLLIWESPWPRSELEPTLDVALILSGSGSMGVWMGQRLNALRAVRNIPATGSIRIHCPRCRKEQDVPMGESSCAGCGMRMRIAAEEPVCLKCGYRLYGAVGRCPECGAHAGKVRTHDADEPAVTCN